MELRRIDSYRAGEQAMIVEAFGDADLVGDLAQLESKFTVQPESADQLAVVAPEFAIDDHQVQQVVVQGSTDGPIAHVTLIGDPVWDGSWLRLDPDRADVDGAPVPDVISASALHDALMEAGRLELLRSDGAEGGFWVDAPIELALALAPGRVRACSTPTTSGSTISRRSSRVSCAGVAAISRS